MTFFKLRYWVSLMNLRKRGQWHLHYPFFPGGLFSAIISNHFLFYLITCLHSTNWVFQKEHCSISWHFIEAKNGTVNWAIRRSGVRTWCLVIGECVGYLKYLSTFPALSEPCLSSSCHSSLNLFTPLPKFLQEQAATPTLSTCCCFQ